MAYRYRVKHPNGQFAVEWFSLDTGKTTKVELTDDKLKASQYKRRSEARAVFDAFPGVDMKMEIC